MHAKALKLATLVVLAASQLFACGGDDTSTPSGSGGQGATSTTSSTGGSSQTTGNGSGGSKSTNTTPDKAACVTESAASPASTSASDACKKFCVAEDHCDSTTTPVECEEYRSCAKLDTLPTACQAANKVFWDCMRAQNEANICVDELDFCCGTQAAAVGSACSTD